ncbi:MULTISPECIES: endolytic transglycosylase MltG [unclassified Paenibacillus]|uniref:endolytic transglycosylase MltG n=1 Tax=unclassified Paenibacillus TaxID=185978 RepID=UPI0009A8013C|nr:MULTISPECIES: endolytic transglycosylase MltG [unclassified Paenibacillus]SLJ97553.1 YceG-like family protein [Paenibacillus sp. RU5A]SOC66918.1 YceG-like family protein [Paenibacillus sp. RU26A]SOC69933.1 YceG-like family protein [Paenibacillus sp. RU5M]
MDKRSLWIGLGSGMIVGAVLLQLATVGQNALSESSLDPELATANLTKEQLEAAAKSMDMKLVASDDELYTEAEWVNKKKQESSELQGKTATAPEATDSAVKPEQPDNPKQPVNNESDKQNEVTQPETIEPSTPNSPEVAATVSFKVRSGNSLAIVAGNLEKAGIVDSAQAFIKAGRAERINTKIQVGTYDLEKGESFKSIIAKITKEPSN